MTPLAEDVPVHRRFHVRLTGLLGGIVLVTVAVGGWAFFAYESHQALEALRGRLRSTANALAVGIDADGVATLRAPEDTNSSAWTSTYERLRRIGDRDPELTSIYVFCATDEPGRLRTAVEWTRGEPPDPPGTPYDASDVPVMVRGLTEPAVEDRVFADAFGASLSGYAPVTASDGTRCLVGLDVEADRIEGARRDVLFMTARVFGLALALLAAASLLVGRTVRGPLALVIDASSAIARGRFGVRVGIERRDEFGLLGQHFDRMAAGLAEREVIRETFGRYVSEDVARKVLGDGGARLGGEERVVTVLFADLRGYSTIAEHLRPPEVVELLNAWLGEMNEVLDAHGGVVIEFLGDAIFAVFGAPDDLPDHAERAVRCAVAMRERMAGFNREREASGLARAWEERGIDALLVRIGLHTGPVVAGNLGSRQRMKYGVTGDAVNVAARLEALNKELGTDILVSEEVRARLGSSVGLRDLGEHHVKGREQAVRVWGV